MLIAAYIVIAAAAAVWLMRDLGTVSIVAGIGISALVGAGASAYSRHLALDR